MLHSTYINPKTGAMAHIEEHQHQLMPFSWVTHYHYGFSTSTPDKKIAMKPRYGQAYALNVAQDKLFKLGYTLQITPLEVDLTKIKW